MEVHHHSHEPVHKKKWTHYFWEFLMLFLAVFCGFLAENIREHQVEHHREKQYMESMVEDLKNDTFLLTYAMKYWDTINQSIDSVAASIKFPVTRPGMVSTYYHLNKALDYYSFVYNDRTVAQLKNSGGFRLIRNAKVANSIILFDQFNNDAMKNIGDIHEDFYKSMMELANKVFVQEIINDVFLRYDLLPASAADAPGIDSMLQRSPVSISDPAFVKSLFEFKNALLAYRKDYMQNMQFGYDKIQLDMRKLIDLIKTEYKID